MSLNKIVKGEMPMLKSLLRIWNEVYGKKQQPAPTVSMHQTHQMQAEPIAAKKVSAPSPTPVKKVAISKALTEVECENDLNGIGNLNDLDSYHQNCPQQFEHLFQPHFLRLLQKVDDIQEIETVYHRMNFSRFDEQIMEQYQKVLPVFLVDCDLEDAESTYEECPDQERFGEAIKSRYQELLDKVDSFDELETRRNNCPEDFNDLFRLPYQKLLLTVDSVEELDEHIGNCPDEFEDFYSGPYHKLLKKVDSIERLEELKNNCHESFNFLYAWHYRRLLEKESSLSELQDRYENCEECFNGLILARYRDILQTVTSISELDDRYGDCKESFEGLILARCFEMMPLAVKGLSREDFDQFCENIRDEFKPLALACRR